MTKKVESVEARLVNIESELRRIRSLYERTMSYKVNDPETAMMHARKAAEAICRQIFLREYGSSPGNLTLDQLIERLNARSALPRAINVPMRTIQGYGNFAAHEQDGNTPEAMTPEYIQPCLQALATVVDWYFAEQTKLPPDRAEAGHGEGAAGGLPATTQATEKQAPFTVPAGLTGSGGATRVGDLAQTLGISDAAVMRLAREKLSLELRTPSALLTMPQVDALTIAVRGARATVDAPAATKTVVLGEGIELTFVLIQPGAFRMGSPQEEEGHNDDEVLHEVRIARPFYLARHLVTQAQYEAVVGSNPSYFQGGELPVEMVSWFDAIAFCEMVSERLGRKCRLPTESEWEYACRAGTTSAFSVGNGVTTEQVNFDGKFTYGSAARGTTRWATSPVGSFAANPWGLFDMHGNVWEWCSDWYGDYPRASSVDPTGPAGGEIRILRGGSWFNGPADARSAQRDALDPGRRHSIYGFRIALQTN